ncbi:MULTISPECIES: TerB family tellurite resistance protein [unclassified Yoonia]|uniref:TerB family tellurite resistance protein n=1 Tax=unclassified Yoonia TaxID=2629118 RepID=UPI002AFDFF54|nr:MULTISPECIES: TerB family tellurite resistance protein [unclassified Yoonia]
MKQVFLAGLIWIGFTAPAQAFVGDSGYFNGLAYLGETRIPGPAEAPLALCHTTYDFRVLGLTLTRQVTGFALSSDGCLAVADRLITTEQLTAAQSLGLIDRDIATLDDNDLRRNLLTYGLWAAVGLALVAVVIRRVKSLMGLDPTAPMRKKAATRVLSAMCHVGKCDGIVASAEVALIGDTLQQLTGRSFPASEIMRVADHVDLNLQPQDYIAFGKGLRDHEKDVMMRGVLSVAIASGRIFPAEYEFATTLAHGLGMPGEDFRRVLDLAIADMNARGT